MKYNTPVFKKNQPDDSHKFKLLPTPSGVYPYHHYLPGYESGTQTDKLVFHMVGDTGNLNKGDNEQYVAGAMAHQCQEINQLTAYPCFLYHLGDIVYSYGESLGYDRQFFTPFEAYQGNIFAIPGNHDGDVNPDADVAYQSLEAFNSVFCDKQQQKISFSKNSQRKSEAQPNIYWVLKTPLANIIGLYSNVPKFGGIDDTQKLWFLEQLRWANTQRAGKALIVCIHHAPYSADVNHGSSKLIIDFLDNAFIETGIRPDAVFSGHVHCYQRFNKTYDDGTIVPFIVAGAGGFDELHAIAEQEDQRFTNDSNLFNDVRLMAYCDNQYGFLKLAIEKINEVISLTGKYYTVYKNKVTLADSFMLQLK